MNAGSLSASNSIPKQNRKFRIEFVTDIGKLPELASKWEQLNHFASDHDAPFFQSFAWINHIAQTRNRRADPHFRTFIATVYDDKELIGIWPLALQRTNGIWLARNLDDPFGQFAGVVFRSAEDITEAVPDILNALRKSADGARIEFVSSGSPLHVALLKHGAYPVSTLPSLSVDFRPFTNFNDYLKTINSKTRKNLRNLRNRLYKENSVSHFVQVTPQEVQTAIDYAFKERVNWTKRNARTSPAFQSSHFSEIVGTLTKAEHINTVAFALKSGDDYIAAQWGIFYANRYYAYISATNPKYLEFSPGRLHLGMVLECCHARGIEVAELMPPVAPYKLEWSNTQKDLVTMTLAFNTKGHIASLVLDTALPALRRASRKLPNSIRKPLINLLNKN